MKSTIQKILFAIFLINFSYCSFDNNSQNSAWKQTLKEITLSSSDSIRVGLNRIEISGITKIGDLQIASDHGEIASDFRDNVLWLAVSEGTEIKFGYKGDAFHLPIAVHEKILVKNDTVMIASYLPQKAVYGLQPIIFQVFRKSNQKWSKSYEDIDFMPWMNMGKGYGHGSQYNVSPVLQDTLGGRLYKGTVSFSMPGKWDLKFFTFNDTLQTKVTVTQK